MKSRSGLRATGVFVSALAAILVATPGQASVLDIPSAKNVIGAELDRSQEDLIALYKSIHSQPELSFQEVRTAAKLAAETRRLGFTVTEQVGKTGVVAIYRNGPGPTVMVRTELDALPMEEKTGVPYASKVTQISAGKESFVAHSCGHDLHMAIWVGVARSLLATKNKWKGTLIFVGQPSEELGGGAKAMLDDGLLSRFGKPDFGFALHVGPTPYDEIGYRAGSVTSNSDDVDIRFKGRGGHGSAPNLTIDPVVEAARFIVDVQSVVSREKNPNAFGVISIGSIQGGTARNIIPDEVVLRGTVRSHDADVRSALLSGIRRTAAAVADMAGAPPPEVTLTESTKAVVNDAALTERTATMLKAAFGNKVLQLPHAGTASEDYSEFILAGVPSFFFTIGGYDPAVIADAKAKGVQLPGNHSSLFAPVPGPSIRTGVEAMTLAVMNVLTP